MTVNFFILCCFLLAGDVHSAPAKQKVPTILMEDMIASNEGSYTTKKVQIRKIHPITKRDEEEVHYMIENLDEPLEVILHPNYNLFFKHFAAQGINIADEIQTAEQLELKDCFYTGEVVNHPFSSVAVTMCDDKMEGTIEIDDDVLTVKPDDHGGHVVHKKKQTTITFENDEILLPPPCPVYTIENGVTSHNGQHVTHTCNPGYHLFGPSTRTCLPNENWSGSLPVCISTEYIRENDGLPLSCSSISHIQGGSFQINKEKSGIFVAMYKCEQGYQLIGEELRYCLPSGRWSGVDPECEYASETVQNDEKASNLVQKRQVNSNISQIELLVYLDSGLRSHIPTITDSNLPQVFNYVMALFHMPALESNIHLTIKRIAVEDVTPGTVEEMLGRFCANQSSISPRNHDHAILLVSPDTPMALPTTYEPMGMAYQGGMCRRSSSCSVAKYNNDVVTTAKVVAHELGHSLGMEHNTPGCRGIMGGDNGLRQWSACSARSLKEFLKSEHRSSCLRDHE